MLDDLPRPEEETPDPAERLRERRDDDRDPALEAQRLERSASSGAECARSVRVIYDERGVVAVAELDELGEVGRVPVERVDPLADDESVLALARLEDALEALGRVVVEE